MLTLTQKSPAISHNTSCDASISLADCRTGKPGVICINDSVVSTIKRPVANRSAKAKGNVKVMSMSKAKTFGNAKAKAVATHATEFKPARLSPVGAHLWTLSADQAALDIALDRMIDAVLGKV